MAMRCLRFFFVDLRHSEKTGVSPAKDVGEMLMLACITGFESAPVFEMNRPVLLVASPQEFFVCT